MQPLVWDDRYTLNVPEIDAQHRTLFRLINQFSQAVQAGQTHDALKALLKGLSDYTIEHFSTEERYFAQSGYPQSAAHTREHAELVMQVGGLKSRFDAGKDVRILDVAVFLGEWITRHIEGSDKQYAAFFQKHGLR